MRGVRAGRHDLRRSSKVTYPRWRRTARRWSRRRGPQPGWFSPSVAMARATRGPLPRLTEHRRGLCFESAKVYDEETFKRARRGRVRKIDLPRWSWRPDLQTVYICESYEKSFSGAKPPVHSTFGWESTILPFFLYGLDVHVAETIRLNLHYMYQNFLGKSRRGRQ